MSTAQSDNVVTLPSNAYATMPAVVFKALSDFAKDTGGRPQLGFIAFCDGVAWGCDGHKLMRWQLDDPTGFEPGKTYLARPVKLPAGAERVTVEFLAGAPAPLLAVDLKTGGSASFNSDSTDLHYPNIQAVYDSALKNEPAHLGAATGLDAAYLAFISKHAAAVQKVTQGGRQNWVRPKLAGTGATHWACQDDRLTFVLMPMRTGGA